MTAQITYDVNAPLTSNTIDDFHDVPDIELVPVEVQPASGAADQTIELEVLFDTVNDGTNRAMVRLSHQSIIEDIVLTTLYALSST